MGRVMKKVPLVVLCVLIIAVPSVWADWVTNGVAICSAAGDQHFPAIVSDGAGGAILAWRDSHSGLDTSDIYAQRVNALGAVQWTTDGVALCTATGDQDNPITIVSDGAGGAIVTWYDRRSGNDDIYARRVNASGAVQWTVDGVALCTARDDQFNPAIVSDDAGGAIVTWMDRRSGSHYHIYAQRVNASGAIQWTTDGVDLSTGAGGQMHPAIVSDSAGGAIVTWYDYSSGSNYDIYAQRVNALGTVQWTPNGVALCTAKGDQSDPAIVSDGAGGAIVTWWDYRTGSNLNVYGQRVNASGAVQWTADGVDLSTAAGDQGLPRIVSDATGGAIVTWMDKRSLSDFAIYAQRVNALGAVQWTTDGVALCTATATQPYFTITSDGASGAIVTWMDHRTGNTRLYAQRVDASGAVLWTANGVALSTGLKGLPAITSDGAGGAIVAWADKRTGTNWKIYGLRIGPNGSCALNRN